MAQIKQLSQVTQQMKSLGLKTAHLYMYDVPAEHGADVASDVDLARFARRQRLKILAKCRQYCAPTQQSVWRVRDDMLKPLIDPRTGVQIERYDKGCYTWPDAVEKWKKEYDARNLAYLMEIVPIGTTPEGYDMFIKQEANTMFTWIGNVLKYCTDVEQAQETTKKAYADRKRNLESMKSHIEMDFGTKSPDWPQTKPLYEKLVGAWDEANDRLVGLKSKPIAFEERLESSEE